ncbi:hypothetical protein V2A60_000494 [Cordyceps javanica]|uniref:Uncharacterized protein n=1 Tax=Cordyceps javanica TaxID=43265 RepID=A0A545V583_9HYPO|nr:hypothetical protein IF1G_04111 [Cordyceps javanica]TQW08131.1 hypothetical protein IF2G_04007 [Cordyceps javanica]
MCVEYFTFTPFLCHHIAINERYTAPVDGCQRCGHIQETRLRKKPGAPTMPCAQCCDGGVWVMNEGEWMTRRQSRAWERNMDHTREVERRVADLTVSREEPPQRPQLAEEASEQVATTSCPMTEEEWEDAFDNDTSGHETEYVDPTAFARTLDRVWRDLSVRYGICPPGP